MKEVLLTVVEVAPFPSQADASLSDDERHRLIDYVARNPEAGSLIRGTGGLRKLRWAIRGSGKRGGLRLIYYFYNRDWPVFLLTLYRKGAQKDLTSGQRRKLRGVLRILKDEIRQRSGR